MRLLFINQKLGYAGTSSYTMDLALGLREGQHEVRICTTGGELRSVFTQMGIESYLVKFNLFSFSRLLEYLREYNPDLIHIQNRQSTLFGRRISKRLGVPHVITVHRLPDKPRPDLQHPLLAGIIAVNEVIREFLVNDQNVPKSLIRVIPRGVNVDVLRPDPPPPEDAPGPSLIPVLGSVGSLLRVKGHDVFLRAARRVLDMGVEAFFTVVGDGPESTRLWQLSRKLGLQKHLTFSPHIPDRRELYALLDILVVPTLRGGVGSAVLEAMAMGKPVVGSAVGDILHILEDEKTGLLVPEGSEEELARRMAELISRPDLRRTLGEAARARVVDGFSLEPMLKDTQGFYREMLAAMGDARLSGTS